MAFATAAELAARLGRTFSPTDTAQADAVLADVTAAIQAYTGQHIERATTTEQVEGGYSHRLLLRQRPVVAVHTVRLDGELVTDWRLRGAVLIRHGGWSKRSRRYLPEWGREGWLWQESVEPSTVEVTYTHGYTDIPAPIRAVCRARAAREFANPTAVTSLRIGDYSATYSSGDGFTRDELRIMDRLRRRVGSITPR